MELEHSSGMAQQSSLSSLCLACEPGPIYYPSEQTIQETNPSGKLKRFIFTGFSSTLYKPSIVVLGMGQTEGVHDSDKTEHLVCIRHDVKPWRPKR